ncbi:ATP synthase F1 subunit gamma [Bacteroidota bacterium]
MPNLKEVKTRIKSVISTQQITKAMKMVAASKLRKAQDYILQMRPYSEKLDGILNNVVQSTQDTFQSEFAVEREVKNVLIIPVSSDRGLCGAFNSNIFKQVVYTIQEEYAAYYDNDRLHILPVGKKAYDFFRKRNFHVIADYWDVFYQLSFDKVKLLAEYAMAGFIEEKYDKVIVVYNEFKNVATQVLKVEQFLPLVQEEEQPGQKAPGIDFIFEPTTEFIVKELIPNSIKIKFYKAILESNASEHGARMTAMDQATDNATELLHDLRLAYNRTRQAAITKEILEIVGGAEALAEGE